MSGIHGYVEYKPQNVTKKILSQVKKTLVDYHANESPMTVRQVFYRLVAEYGYDKTEQAYDRLITYISRSRRAYEAYCIKLQGQAGLEPFEAAQQAAAHPQLIPFHWIRDDKGQSRQPFYYKDKKDFIEGVKRDIDGLRLDRQIGQPRATELWCEAAGMIPLMAEIASPYGIRVSSGGGYDSVTAKHRLAQRVIGRDVPTTILHIGDFDPSGEGMFETLTDDVGQMIEDYGRIDHYEVQRIALREDQVIKMKVETAPPKPLDSRTKAFIKKHPTIRKKLKSDNITAQLEALTPPDLRKLITEHIEDTLDQDAIEKVKKRETLLKGQIKRDLKLVKPKVKKKRTPKKKTK